MSNTSIHFFLPEDMLDYEGVSPVESSWPTDMGIVCSIDDNRIIGWEPFHREENLNVVLRRFARSTGLNLNHIPKDAIYAKIYENEDLGNPRIFARLVRSVLFSDATVLEAVDDYNVNYDYARSKGLTVEDLSGDDEIPAPIKADFSIKYVAPEYVVEKSNEFSGAFFERGEQNCLVLRLPKFNGDFQVGEQDVLCREDGMGVAISVNSLMKIAGACPGRLIIPKEFIPAFDNLGLRDALAMVTIKGHYLIATVVSNGSGSIEPNEFMSTQKNNPSFFKSWGFYLKAAGFVILAAGYGALLVL